MVKLVRKELVNEAKQVGTLYHVCTLDAFVNYIIPKDELKASGKYYNKLLDTKEAISFTRDSLFVVPTYTVDNADILFQFEVDGDKLSEKYKIIPYNGNGLNPIFREKEEVVLGPIKNFKSYVRKVTFDIKSLHFNNTEDLIGKLKQVQGYLGNISCDRTNLPYLSEDDWSILYSKTKDKFKIETLDEFINLLEKNRSISIYPDTIDLFFNNIHSYSYDDLCRLLKEHPSWKKKLNLLLPSLLDLFDENRDLELASFLIKNKFVNVNIMDNDGNTYLNNACSEKDSDKIFFLLENGADVNQKNKDGITPLMNYIISKPTDDYIIDVLVKYGAKINEQDNEGNTALHYAIIHGNSMRIIKCLLNNGSDRSIENKYGMTPMDYAS